MLNDFHGMNVTVMGLGAFDGGVGAITFLAQRGAHVVVTDIKPAEALAESLARIAQVGDVTLHLGAHQDADFTACDLLVVSPGVPRNNPFVLQARDAGIAVTSEMNLFWERNRGRTICVTGTAGKSTTAALIHAMLAVPASHAPAKSQSGPIRPACWLGGNIGRSLLPFVDQIRSDDWVVLELSSFQLEDLESLQPNPHLAVVTNFAPNHLDRHGAIEEYRRAKQNLLRWQTSDRIAIFNQNDADVATWPTAAQRFWFGRDDEGRQGLFAIGFEGYKRRALFRHGQRERVLPLGDWFSLPGIHNFQNVLAATCAATLLDVAVDQVEAGLRSFQGLPHRLKLVAEAAGRRFYDDSKATTPEAALRAVESFHDPIVLLAGGFDKGVDLSDFVAGLMQRNVKAISLMGQTGERLEGLIRAADVQHRVAAQRHQTFDAAFNWAVSRSAPGDVVLLSPGCASYDWFRNYEARGDEFARLARAWSARDIVNGRD